MVGGVECRGSRVDILLVVWGSIDEDVGVRASVSLRLRPMRGREGQ